MPIIKPFMTSLRFNSTIGAGTGTGATFAIAATAFSTDAGTAATAFPSTFAYYNLYINGVLQPGGTSTVTTSTLTIPDGDAENDGVSVLVEFVVN
ncbi:MULTISPECIES: DUF4183 domain-containing protein [Brevibacillus]|jgi:hypothetical protein|uniref:DUF4183 domain-containing protein n=1 Tax=Brevibacillus parabrevis TaxID=54914 RepID=A0A4Y3PGI4_BREPA|nr:MULTISPECIES: DUF4183 domain-containing protein [Brevibacillus]MBU8714871.1 DUF4183 domain-containing protein [Brevibacillus parabrevis]MDH6352873.1 hypothetical protein [Brevibacillus sp. 1238]MDR5000730.1 DUF4183 domain-containing protein [Brevibacillus parabrevis]MED2253164.1 DUF4183 domain-containing protein [Brevibacillus parabrevis]NRQ55523.1 DUF4183 domain-containing protein [Brevibacillus sp. HD1.4A]